MALGLSRGRNSQAIKGRGSFTGIWLEAVFHQLIVTKHGRKNLKGYGFKSYRDKLNLLGVFDAVLLSDADNLQEVGKRTKICFVHVKWNLRKVRRSRLIRLRNVFQVNLQFYGKVFC